jgi:hypothetical protein
MAVPRPPTSRVLPAIRQQSRKQQETSEIGVRRGIPM